MQTICFAAGCLPRISKLVDQLIIDAILGWVGTAIRLSLELRTLRITVHPSHGIVLSCIRRG